MDNCPACRQSHRHNVVGKNCSRSRISDLLRARNGEASWTLSPLHTPTQGGETQKMRFFPSMSSAPVQPNIRKVLAVLLWLPRTETPCPAIMTGCWASHNALAAASISFGSPWDLDRLHIRSISIEITYLLHRHVRRNFHHHRSRSALPQRCQRTTHYTVDTLR